MHVSCFAIACVSLRRFYHVASKCFVRTYSRKFMVSFCLMKSGSYLQNYSHDAVCAKNFTSRSSVGIMELFVKDVEHTLGQASDRDDDSRPFMSHFSSPRNTFFSFFFLRDRTVFTLISLPHTRSFLFSANPNAFFSPSAKINYFSSKNRRSKSFYLNFAIQPLTK